MVAFALAHRDILQNVELVATGTTGKRLMEATGLPVQRVQSGPYGGDQQIGAMVANGEVAAVIFLRDPLLHSRTSQISRLFCGCVMYTISPWRLI